jgi:hypothetical protein
MLCYGFPWPWVPTCNAKVSSYLEPLLQLVDQITFYIFSHTTEQDLQPTTALISKQAIPYQTRGGTCCPGVSTDGFQSSPPFQPMLKPQHQTLPRSTHISMDARPILSTITQAKLNIKQLEDLYNTHDCMAKHN